MTTERALLAGGGFWGMQDVIRKQPGVISTRIGYTGREMKSAIYRNHEGHAEAIEIFSIPPGPATGALLEFFFQIHDPTTRNRQGNDWGTSYRSARSGELPRTQLRTSRRRICGQASGYGSHTCRQFLGGRARAPGLS